MKQFVLPFAVTQLAIRIITGRQHQIRSHCAHVGHPVLTDGKYTSMSIYVQDQRFATHNALHRHRLGFRDSQGQSCEVVVPMSPELASTLRQLVPKQKELRTACGAQSDTDSDSKPFKSSRK